MNEDEMKLFDWEDEISKDGEEFIVLEEGDYTFEVTKFERSTYTPGPKSTLPACNMAVVTLMVRTEAGEAYVTEKMQLCEKMEWKLSAFFRSIGMKKHGEPLAMRWQDTIGRTGKAHITKTAGTQNTNVYFNNIGKFLDPEPAAGDGLPWG